MNRSHSGIRFGDFHPSHRLRFVGPAQKLVANGWPMRFQIAGKLANGHPVDARATFVSPHAMQCCLQIFSLTNFLHQSMRSSWAFGITCRPERLGRLASRFPGFTRRLGFEVRLMPDILPFAALEVHVLLVLLLVQAFSGTKCTHLLCHLLTSAVRSDCLSTTSVAECDTR